MASAEWTAAASRTARAALEAFLAAGAKLAFEPAPQPVVSVLLVLHGRAELTLRCLLSLRGTDLPFEVVLVDNASPDETPRLLARLDGVTAVRNRENLGFVRGANQAAERARGELLLFLNNDCELLPGSLDAAVERLQRESGVGAVVGKLIGLDGRLQEAGSIVWREGFCVGYGRGENPAAPPYMFERDVDYGSAAFLLTPRDVFRGLSGFDTAYAPAYYEDADYGLRLWSSGRRVVYEPRAVALHHEFASAASREAALAEQERRRPVFEARRASELRDQPSAAAGDALAARARPAGRRILFVDDRVPHAALGQGYPRALEIVASLRRAGCFITHYPLFYPGEAWDSVYAELPRDVEVITGAGLAGFAAFCREREGYYDAVLVSRASNLRALRESLGATPFGRTPWIYDAEALAALREPAGEAGVAAEVELASGAAAVTCVSKAEAGIFHTAGHRVVVLGHALDPMPGNATSAERSGLLFTGAVTEDDSPNAEALEWLIREVLPRIAALEGRAPRLVVAGRIESARIRALLGPDVVHTGAVESLAPLFDAARVFVAPMRRGAGLPMKAHQAAAHGVPIVATPLVAAQLGWQDGKDLLVAADADAFARACVELGRQEALWSRLRDGALLRIGSDCRREDFDAALREALEAACGSLALPGSRPAVPLRVPELAAGRPGSGPAVLPEDREDRAALLDTALVAARHELRALRASASWRITAPLRALHARLTGGRGRPRG